MTNNTPENKHKVTFSNGEKERILLLVKEYTQAFLIAEQNPKRMLSNELTSSEAAEIMRQLQLVENKLFIYGVCLHAEAPNCLKAHFEAIDNYACGRCWMSSDKNRIHPECEKKIALFFSTREKLVEFGKTLLEQEESK